MRGRGRVSSRDVGRHLKEKGVLEDVKATWGGVKGLVNDLDLNLEEGEGNEFFVEATFGSRWEDLTVSEVG